MSAPSTVRLHPIEHLIADLEQRPKYIPLPDLEELFGVSGATISLWSEQGTFPPAIRLGAKSIRYSRASLIEHFRRQLEAETGPAEGPGDGR